MKKRKNGKAIVLYPTNVSAINVGCDAVTIDKFFGKVVGVDREVNIKKMEGYTLVLVEEFSQMCIYWWTVLARAKREYPGLKIMIFGDWRQLPGVEKKGVYDVANSSMIKFLTGGNREELEYHANARYDTTMKAKLDVLLDDGKFCGTGLLDNVKSVL